MNKKLLLLILLVAALLSVAPAAAGGKRPLTGRWHRLNPNLSNSTPDPEHEVKVCGGNRSWNCRYDKDPEQDLGFEHPPDSTSGRFGGETISILDWACPTSLLPDCAEVSSVVSGEMIFSLPDGSDFSVNQELIVTESGGVQVLYVHWVDQFACPWFRSFDEALTENPLPNPSQDCIPAQ